MAKELDTPPPEATAHPVLEGEPSGTLGISGRIAQAFINAPVTPMILVGCLFIGLLGLFFTPRQEDPQISVPMIDLFVQYPGADAKEVESLVTRPLERIMNEIPGVQHVYSATMRGAAIVTVRFYVGQEMGPSLVKVHDKLQSNLDKIPPNVRMPLVKPVSVDDVPVVTATLWSREVGDNQLRTLALDVLQELGTVKDTGKSFVVGGRQEQIRVEVLMERLAGYGITLDRIAGTIQSANSELAAGEIESGGLAYTVYSGAFLRTADDVSRLVVGTKGELPIYVRDVATVEQRPEDASQIVTHSTGPAFTGVYKANGEQAVTLAIAKKEKTNGVVVAEAVLKKLEQLEGTLIPANVHVEITRNYGKTANDKVNELLRAMFEAVLIVSILCLIGLGARASFVVITVIPVVILLTIWWAMMVSYTIDRVSLFALIFSIGILVDDAIVVVENIFRHWLTVGKTSISQAVWAVDEVGNPTILATFTIVAALLPMGWVSGLMGPYMRPIPVLGSAAMIFSLFAAFVFTPWFTLRMRPEMAALHKAEQREERTHRIVSRFYRPLVMPLVRNRALGIAFLITICAAVCLSLVPFYTQAVAVKMLPFDNKPEFSVVINMPEGTALPETANVVRQLAEKVKEIPEVTAVQTYTGTAQPFNFNGMVRHYYLRRNPWEGDLLVMLKDKKTRSRSSHQLAVVARHLLLPVARRMGARIAVVEMPPGPPVLQTVVAEVYGPNEAVRRQVAKDMTGMFEKTANIVDADNYMDESYEYWRFEVDTEKAVRRGISVDTINQNLAMAMGGFKVGDVKRGNVLEPTYIVLQVPLANRSELGTLGSLPIASPAGGTLPLGELGRFVRQPEDHLIYHTDLRPMEYVVGEMEGFLGAPLYGMFEVERQLVNYTTPDNKKMTGMFLGGLIGRYGAPADEGASGFEWGGEWTVTYETFRDMGAAFMAALVLIYGLIVWEFGDFALAGLIMAPIPLTLIGIVPGHWIMGAEFTATSMIGLIALGGIIVRQSILIVSFVKIEVAKGKSVREAAVAGAEIRMRPIVITSLTVAGGAWTLMFDPIFQGMAVSTFFGVLVGTLLAVIIIPLGCISLSKHFYMEKTADGEIELSSRYAELEEGTKAAPQRAATPVPASRVRSVRTPLWLRLWGGLMTLIFTTISIVTIVWLWISVILGLFVPKRKPKPKPKPTGPASPPPPTGGGTPPSGGGGGAPPGPAALPGGPQAGPAASAPQAADPSAAAAHAIEIDPEAGMALRPGAKAPAVGRKGPMTETMMEKPVVHAGPNLARTQPPEAEEIQPEAMVAVQPAIERPPLGVSVELMPEDEAGQAAFGHSGHRAPQASPAPAAIDGAASATQRRAGTRGVRLRGVAS